MARGSRSEDASRSQCRRSRSEGVSYSAASLLLCIGSLLLIEIAVKIAQEDPLAQQTHGGILIDYRQLAASGSGCDQADATTPIHSSSTHASIQGGSVSSAGDHEGEHRSKAFEPIVFFLIAYLSSALAQQITQLLPPRIRVPHSVNLYLIGAGLAALARQSEDSEFGVAITQFTQIDPHVIFWILLPALLYEDASSVHWHVFERCVPNALTLAVPGVIVNTLLTGTIVKVVFSSIEWTWSAAFLLGSILSATDPVAVIGALHQLSAPDKLSSLISGESLFNDGSAVVLFHLFWDLARKIREFDFGYTILFFSRMALGGPALGFTVSLVVWIWLRFTVRFQIEILIIIVSIYGLFFVAEHEVIQVSGVLAVVCFGFFMASIGHYALDIDKEYEHHAIINFLALLSNEAIFLIAGLVSFRLTMVNQNIILQDYLELLFLYVVIHATRAAVIALFFPILKRSGYGLTMKEATICVYGGLRGAVGIAMALLVEHDKSLDEATRDRIAFHTSGIVFGTLLINGTTITTVYKKLKIYSHAAHHEQLLVLALRKAHGIIQRHAKQMKEHWFFHNCQLDLVMRLVPKLSESTEHYSSHGSRQTDSPETVFDVMEELATRMGVQHQEHMVKKLRMSWKRTEHPVPNPFLIDRALGHTDAMAQEQDDELELALQLADDDNALEEMQDHAQTNSRVSRWGPLASMRKWKSEFNLSSSNGPGQLDVQNSPPKCERLERLQSQGSVIYSSQASTPQARFESQEEAIKDFSPPTSPKNPEIVRERARRRWKWAYMKLSMAMAIMRETRKSRRETIQVQPRFSKAFSASSGGTYSKALERFVRDDEASMVEIHQTVINAAKATLKCMFEARSLTADSYSIVHQTLNVQEEFISHVVEKSSGSRSNTTLEGPALERMSQCFAVAWGSLMSTLFRPASLLFWLASKVVRVDHWLEACWCLHKRDIEVVLAYIFTQDHLLEDLEILEDFKEEVREPLNQVTQQAKREALLGFVQKPHDCAMFILFEHILFARLIIRAQFHLLEHLAHDGILVEEDVEHIIKHVLSPREYALTKYVPSVEQLRKLGSSKVDDYHANFLKSFLMKFIIELEFHEEDLD